MSDKMSELEIVNHRQIKGLSVFFNTVDYRTPHFHREWELAWVLENRMYVTCGAQRYLAGPGDILLFNPNEPHEFHKEKENCTFLCFQISKDALPSDLPVHIDEKILNHCMKDQAEGIKTQLAKIMWHYLQREEHFPLYCIGKACLIQYRLRSELPVHVLTTEELQNIDKRNARLQRLLQFVDENYMHKIRLSDFAEQEGCSMSYLSRFIKNTLNQNFQDYVKSVRFNCACKLIAAGKMRMLEVCMESGFSDYRYFSGEFHRQYHMTPEEYSRHAKRQELESEAVRRSLHSNERFYSREESLTLFEKFLQGYME